MPNVKTVIKIIFIILLLITGIKITIFFFSDNPEHIIDEVTIADDEGTIFSCENGMSKEFFFKAERDYVKGINVTIEDEEADIGSLCVTLVYANGDMIYIDELEITQASEGILQYDLGEYLEKGKECYLYVTPGGFNQSVSFAVSMAFGNRFNIEQALIRTFLLFGIIATVIFIILEVPAHKIYLCFTDQNVLKQLWCIAGMFLLFGSCAVYYGIVYKNGGITGIFILIPLIAAYIYAGIVLYRNKLYSLKRIEWISKLKEKAPVIVLLLLSACLRFPMLGDLPIWDAGEYYGQLISACESFRFSTNIADMLWNFRLVSHTTIAWAMFSACGIFIDPTGVTGILLVYLVLTLCAIGALYRCFRLWNPKLSEMEAAVCAFFVSVTPLFLGTFSHIYPDYGMAVFFIFMITMFLEKKYLLAVFWAIAVTQTKEPGIMLVFGYFIFHILKNLICTKGNIGKRMKGLLYDKVNWCALWTGIVYAIYLWRQNGLIAWAGVTVMPVRATIIAGNTDIPEAAEEVVTTAVTNNYFGINPEYIIDKLKQYSIMNFSWICIAVILLYLCFKLYRRIMNRPIAVCSNEMPELLGGCLGFIAIGIFFVTYPNSRYNVVLAIILAIGSAYCFSRIFVETGRKRYAAMIGGIIVLLFGGQSFASIDLISNHVFDTVETGKGKILFTDKDSIRYGAGLVNNYQFNYVGNVYGTMLKECDYNEEMVIINCGKLNSTAQINGSASYSIGWNLQSKRRIPITKYTDMSDVIPIETVYYFVTEEAVDYGQAIEGFGGKPIPEKAILYFPTYYEFYEEDALRCLGEIYDIGEMRQVEVMGGTLKYYECIRKQDRVDKNL